MFFNLNKHRTKTKKNTLRRETKKNNEVLRQQNHKNIQKKY